MSPLSPSVAIIVCMDRMNDIELVEDYVEGNSQEAFAALVQRHINLVYSAALRHAGNPNQAEDVTQSVFIALARKAAGLRKGTILSGWLYQTARNFSLSSLRAEARRQRREQEAYMRSSLTDSPGEAPWEKLAPVLDEALARLGHKDRNAILLRFFEGRSMLEVGLALGLKEPAAKKRIGRALDKLRTFFARRGVATSAGALAGALAAHSVQAAPAALAERIIGNPALAGGAGAGLLAGFLALLSAWKTPLLIGGACAAAAIVGVLVHHSVQRDASAAPVGPDSAPPSGGLSDGQVEDQLLAGAYVSHLGRAVTARGVVLDPDGQPVSGASVFVQSALEGLHEDSPQGAATAGAQQRETTTQADGSFSLAGCKPGKNFLTAKAKGFPAKSLEVELAQDSRPLNLTLQPGPALPLRVADKAGLPVPGATAWLNPHYEPYGGSGEAKPRRVKPATP